MIKRTIEKLKKRRASAKELRRHKKVMSDAKDAGIVDDNGHLGTVGIVPGMGFVNMPYSAGSKDVVFIQVDEEVNPREWERMDLREAKAHGEKIIPCHYCASPAIVLDHGYPWQTEKNACKTHLNTFDEMLRRK